MRVEVILSFKGWTALKKSTQSFAFYNISLQNTNACFHFGKVIQHVNSLWPSYDIDDKDLGQRWLKWQLVAWWHRTNIDFSLVTLVWHSPESNFKSAQAIILYNELENYTYRKTSNISRTLVGNKIVDHSDVVGASPVGAAPTTSSFST